MRTRFLLVRHATCARSDEILFGRALDVALDAKGRLQARTVAARLGCESPLRVESSPRLRTLQTARAIAAAAQCDLQVAPALDELDFGHWAGRTFAELEHDYGWRRWNLDRDHARTPAGIGIRGVQRSIGGYLASLARTCAGATLVLVTHAEIIRSLVLRCMGAPACDYPRIAIEPASVTRISVDARGARLEMANERVLP